MPIITYLDDVIFDGSDKDFEKIALCASLYAVTVLCMDARIVGNPPVYYPVSESPHLVNEFLLKYREAFDFITANLESAGVLDEVETA